MPSIAQYVVISHECKIWAESNCCVSSLDAVFFQKVFYLSREQKFMSERTSAEMLEIGTAESYRKRLQVVLKHAQIFQDKEYLRL